MRHGYVMMNVTYARIHFVIHYITLRFIIDVKSNFIEFNIRLIEFQPFEHQILKSKMGKIGPEGSQISSASQT